MNIVCLQIFVTESSRHHGKLTYEWLLDTAQRIGITGGSAFQAIAGFGRHGRFDAGFFELAGELPVVIEFFVEPDMADQLLQAIGKAELKLVYTKLPAEIGITA
jgi:PII-like signaling protein